MRMTLFLPLFIAIVFSIPILMPDVVCCDDKASGIQGGFVLIFLCIPFALSAILIQLVYWFDWFATKQSVNCTISTRRDAEDS
jgi:hypothetical protein